MYRVGMLPAAPLCSTECRRGVRDAVTDQVIDVELAPLHGFRKVDLARGVDPRKRVESLAEVKLRNCGVRQ